MRKKLPGERREKSKDMWEGIMKVDDTEDAAPQAERQG